MDDPELYLFDPSDLPGAEERRATLARQRDESRRRYHALVEAAVIAAGTSAPSALATAVLAALVDHRGLDGSDCHERRQAIVDSWTTSMHEFWASPEGMEQRAAREAEEAELAVWLADHPDVAVDSHGGRAPEQWEGCVAGRSFYFRERHGSWRIELDLRPSGRVAQVWKGVDADGKHFPSPAS